MVIDVIGNIRISEPDDDFQADDDIPGDNDNDIQYAYSADE